MVLHKGFAIPARFMRIDSFQQFPQGGSSERATQPFVPLVLRGHHEKKHIIHFVRVDCAHPLLFK